MGLEKQQLRSTTASFNVLPQILNCREFVNADEIAKGNSYVGD